MSWTSPTRETTTNCWNGPRPLEPVGSTSTSTSTLDEHEIDEAEDEDYTDWPLPSHSFRRGPVDDRLLADLVLLVHEYDGTDFLLLPADLSWAVGVYDGGVDAVLRNEEEAEELARRFQKWLPPSGWPGLDGRRRPATQRERHRGFGN